MSAPIIPTDLEGRRGLPLGIAGAGRLGSALAGALAAAGYQDIRLASRTAARAEEAARALGVTAVPLESLADDCALVFLAVPDRAIAGLAAGLPWRAGQGVVHASGALGRDVLAAAHQQGALTGCLHPLQTFPGAATREACAALFSGVTCGVEGEFALGALIEAITVDLGSHPVRLEGVDRALYHAAAVLVSNDVVALMAASTRAWTLAGLPADAARGALAPLLLAAASNVARLPLEQALTGPVARGDAETVARHLRALAADGDLATAYRALARELLRLDLGHAPETTAALRALLEAD